jgi:hypothetical protein
MLSAIFGGVAEAAADFVSEFALGFRCGQLSASWRDLPVLLLAPLMFSTILTGALLTRERFSGGPPESTSRWFKAFTLGFLFLGSHFLYKNY